MSGLMPLSPEIGDELRRLGTATLFEASRLPCALPSALQAAWQGASIVGRALPVETVAGDNLPLHLALEAAQAGDVLVVDAGAGVFGHWGEVMTVSAVARDISGLVINGCIRDIDAIAALRFPVFATGRCILGTRKGTRGRVGQPITIEGTRVRLGDVIVGDADGAVAIPFEQFDDVLAASRRRADEESAYLERLRRGESTVDIYGLRSLGIGTSDPST